MEDIKELYDLYAKDIYKFIISLTLNHEAAEDIMQNTFVSAMKNISTFKGHSSVKTWLMGIAKNEYYTYLRKNPKNIQLDDTYEIEYIDENKEAYISTVEEINKLKEPQKQILILRLINEMSFKEIGIIVGKSENYCRVNFFREKQKLWEVLEYE
ncbi:MAG: RNA polymerase sigma factor [Peptostreptococcaceae bacterium]